MSDGVTLKMIAVNDVKTINLKPWSLMLMRIEGRAIFVHPLGYKVLAGCERWGYHVWGAEAFSVADGCEGLTPIVLVDENAIIYKDERGWELHVYGLRASRVGIKPWSPISLIAKVKEGKTMRKGTLLVLGSVDGKNDSV